MKITSISQAILFCLLITMLISSIAQAQPKIRLFTPDDKRITCTGRIDFSTPKLPRLWTGASYVTARFHGTSCKVIINDLVRWGKYHNYLEVAVDDNVPTRIQTTGPTTEFTVAQDLPKGTHTVTICKDTEAAIGYIEFAGIECESLLPPSKPLKRKLEFIGDSITAGAKSDQSDKPCGVGDWYEQDNAYMGYGPRTARALNAQWHVTAVSGIGMVHSCCDMKVTMPDVFSKTNLAQNGKPWDFSQYQPDAVTICLGQNDGGQDPATFIGKYVQFIATVRSVYPKAQIVCLTSPMAAPSLTKTLQDDLTQIVAHCNAAGDKNVHNFFFPRSYNGGCDSHPSVAEHALIAKELTDYLSSLLRWN